jgi:hypothetical protein
VVTGSTRSLKLTQLDSARHLLVNSIIALSIINEPQLKIRNYQKYIISIEWIEILIGILNFVDQ